MTEIMLTSYCRYCWVPKPSRTCSTHILRSKSMGISATAAIAEMLIQSHVRTPDGGFELHLLPSLPSAIPEGSVKGLRARGGFEVDIDWKEGKLTHAKVRSDNGEKLHLRYVDKTLTLKTKKGMQLLFNGELRP